MDAASRGATALEEKDFPFAVEQYTLALRQSPRAVSYYIQRSLAHLRLKPSEAAKSLHDADVALLLARERGKRELIGQAQLRRAIALFSLERFADAGRCFEWAKKINPMEKSLTIWEVKVKEKMEKLEQGDERGAVKVEEVPLLDVDAVIKELQSGGSEPANMATETEKSITITEETAAPASQAQTSAPSVADGVVQTPPSKIRHEWYQNTETITLSLMVKGVPKDKASVDIQSGSLAISFPLPTGSDYDFSLDPLYARVDPEKSTYKILGTKIEVTLKKAEPGKKWHDLEGTEPVSREDTANTTQEDAGKRAVLGENTNTAGTPAYPTSSKSGPKNWDKLASDLTKKKPKPKPDDKDDAEADCKGDSNAQDDDYMSDDEGDAVNGFFKKLYGNADPDTRRAMMKSYTESNGTALSTNWSEVQKGPVETSPPDGMEAKSWEK